jgi:glycosyltransferase involved in cell wall biosynthesis
VELLPRPDGTLILTVGRLAHYKGHEALLQAIAKLPDTTLWIVGDGERYDALKRTINQLGIDSRVRLWGAVDEATLWRCYKTCDVFCLASDDRTEAFGVVLLEAAHFKKPVIVRDIPGSGVPWVARQIEGGQVVGLDDEEGLGGRRLLLGGSGSLPEGRELKTDPPK